MAKKGRSKQHAKPDRMPITVLARKTNDGLADYWDKVNRGVIADPRTHKREVHRGERSVQSGVRKRKRRTK